MNGKFILFSGSASRSCSGERLDAAVKFLDALVQQILQAGGGFMVLLGDEDRTKGDDGKPRAFDWTILRAVERYAESTIGASRVYARVVMSDDAWLTRMNESNRKTFSNLQQRGTLEVERIPRELFTGGEYRRIQCELAHAMVAMGGGKGTYSVGKEMLDLGKPVLPLDLKIGAFSEDGEGALLLHRELQANPALFFSATHDRVADQIETVSLQGGPSESAARRAVEILHREISHSWPHRSSRVTRWYGMLETAVSKFLTATGVMRAIDFLRQLAGL